MLHNHQQKMPRALALILHQRLNLHQHHQASPCPSQICRLQQLSRGLHLGKRLWRSFAPDHQGTRLLSATPRSKPTYSQSPPGVMDTKLGNQNSRKSVAIAVLYRAIIHGWTTDVISQPPLLQRRPYAQLLSDIRPLVIIIMSLQWHRS